MAAGLVDAYASERHYVSHLAPIWKALPDEVRGTFRCSTPQALHAAREHGLPNLDQRLVREWRQPRKRPIMVASFNDLHRAKGRPAVFVEHGAGQSYDGDPEMVGCSWYPGGTGREHVSLFVCPSERVAQQNRDRYPDAAYAVVGCPALDVLHEARQQATRNPDVLTVGCSFHWPCRLTVEAGWAWPHYAACIAELVHTTPWRWLGHAHPRALEQQHLHRWWGEIGAHLAHDLTQLAREADLFIADNTSALYELAALDIPVVVLNSPEWRRNIDHDLRFWSMADVGVQVDEPAQLEPAIHRALEDPPAQAARRRQIAHDVYAVQPSHATEAAVEAIVAHLTT